MDKLKYIFFLMIFIGFSLNVLCEPNPEPVPEAQRGLDNVHYKLSAMGK